MKRFSVMGLMISFSFLVVGCLAGPGPAPPISPEKTSRESSRAANDRPVWQVEWDRVVAAARQEGKVVVYTSLGPSVRASLGPPLKDRYGIDLEFVSGRPPEIMQKITMERNSGLYMADIGIGGSTSGLEMKDAGFTESVEPLLILPEVKDPKMWLGSKLNFIDEGRHILQFGSNRTALLAYNTELVKPPLQSFRELVDGRWKGKIVVYDPTVSGSGLRFATAMEHLYGADFLRALAKQEPLITRDPRLQVEWIARGKYALGTGVSTEPMADFMQAGAPIRYGYPADHVFSSASTAHVAAVTKRPHPNATRVFVNWLLGQEGQTVHSKVKGIASRRLDVSTEWFSDPEQLVDPNKKYVDLETEEMVRKTLLAAGMAREIFGPLLVK